MEGRVPTIIGDPMKILTLCYEYPPLGGGGSKVVAGSAIPFALRLAHRNHYDINHTHFIFPDGLAVVRQYLNVYRDAMGGFAAASILAEMSGA
jgi:hypothetical protein